MVVGSLANDGLTPFAEGSALSAEGPDWIVKDRWGCGAGGSALSTGHDNPAGSGAGSIVRTVSEWRVECLHRRVAKGREYTGRESPVLGENLVSTEVAGV